MVVHMTLIAIETTQVAFGYLSKVEGKLLLLNTPHSKDTGLS